VPVTQISLNFSGHATPMIDGPSLMTLAKLMVQLRFDETAVKFNVKKILAKDPLHFIRWGLEILNNCRPSVVKATTTELVKQALYTRNQLEMYSAKYDWKIDRNTDGILNIYWSGKDLIDASKSNHLFEAQGVPMKVLSQAQCIELEPTLQNIKFVGGLYCPIDISADTRLVCQEIEKLLVSRGASFEYNRKVVNYNEGNLFFSNGEQSPFEKVVFCSGSQVELFKDRVPHQIYWIKGHSVTWTFDSNEKFPRIPIFDTQAKVVITPFGNRLRIVGIAELTGKDTTVDETKIDYLKKQMRRLMPHVIEKGKILNESKWACLRTTSSNSCPIVQKIHSNVIVNVGHGHIGSTVSFHSAKRVADLLEF
jgi:D-amino-acid dehydrogenase